MTNGIDSKIYEQTNVSKVLGNKRGRPKKVNTVVEEEIVSVEISSQEASSQQEGEKMVTNGHVSDTMPAKQLAAKSVENEEEIEENSFIMGEIEIGNDIVSCDELKNTEFIESITIEKLNIFQENGNKNKRHVVI